MRAYSKRLKDLRRYSTYEWKYTDVDGILYVYVGITVDVNRRFADHNAEHTQYKHYSPMRPLLMKKQKLVDIGRWIMLCVLTRPRAAN